MESAPNVNILLQVPESYLPKAEYVFRNFCTILGLNPVFSYGAQGEAVHIYYGASPRAEYPVSIAFKERTAAFYQKTQYYHADEVNFREFRGEMIPFLFSRGGEVYGFAKQNCIINKDIIASAFYFLSCWQEYVESKEEDSQGRVDYARSLQHHWNFTQMPVVDIYAQILENAIKRSLPQLAGRSVFEREKSFTLALSHDIDYWRFWTKKHLLDTLKYNLKSFKKRPAQALYKLIGHAIHKSFFHSHYRLLRSMVKKEEALGTQSTWFLMGKEDYPDKRQSYIKEPAVQKEIKKLLSTQDVGLHGSPQAAFDISTLKAEKRNLEALGFDIKGYRTHYLYFDYQKSFALLEEAGFAYDSTLGYWESIGFRCGTSFPFYPYNLAEDRAFKVMEIPLIVMDTTMLSPKAMALSVPSARAKLRKMTSLAEKYKSLITILWHNTNFDPIDFPLWGALYRDTIKHAQKRGASITSLTQVHDKWSNLN